MKYNPVGMLTFMEKLAKDQTYRQETLGIFTTHPPSKDRADAIIAELKRRGIAINRRSTSKVLALSTKETEVKGQKVYQVLIGDKPIYTVASTAKQSSKERADEIVKRLDPVLDQNPGSRDVKLMADSALVIKDKTVIEFRTEDAALEGLSLQELADKTKQTVERILYDTWLKEMYW